MKLLCFSAILAVGALGAPTRGATSVVHEERHNAGRWRRTPTVDKDAVVPVRIGLVQQNLHAAYDHVMSVADPSSKSYGKHWTLEQVHAEFAPAAESVESVKTWLASSGIQDAWQTPNAGWISFETTLRQLEALFETEYREYHTTRDGLVRLGCEKYSLPEHIAPHVDYITPGVKLSPPMKKSTITKRAVNELYQPAWRPGSLASGDYSPPAGAASLPTELRDCGLNITPPCIRALYEIPFPTAEIASGSLGVFEYTDEYLQEDLNDYFAKYAPYVPQGTHPTLVSINNDTAPATTVGDPTVGGESDVDFDIVYYMLGGRTNVTLYESQDPSTYVGSDATIVDPFLDAIDGSFCTSEEKSAGFQCGGDSLTTVVTASYETPELFEQTRASQERACNEFMKYTLQGHTFVFSSGDYGVASNPAFGEPLCLNNGCVPASLMFDPEENLVFNGTIFSPGFPSNCPYVLAVGATQLTSNQTVLDPESAMNIPKEGYAGCDGSVSFSSSGGFSNYFSRPSYQNTAVAEYFASHDPGYPYYSANAADVTSNTSNIGANGGIYNRPGRAIPDVAANGAYMAAFVNGVEGSIDGTSLATPIWASIITMLNHERALIGKSPVGLIQPVLYAHPEVFHDITKGSNPGCGTAGFSAVEGWDPITGLGTPNYPALLALFLALH